VFGTPEGSQYAPPPAQSALVMQRPGSSFGFALTVSGITIFFTDVDVLGAVVSVVEGVGTGTGTLVVVVATGGVVGGGGSTVVIVSVFLQENAALVTSCARMRVRTRALIGRAYRRARSKYQRLRRQV
jgi:hypothetical protein